MLPKSDPWWIERARTVAARGGYVVVAVPTHPHAEDAIRRYQEAAFVRRRGRGLEHESGGFVLFVWSTGELSQVAGTRPDLVLLVGVAYGPIVDELRRRAAYHTAPVETGTRAER